MSRFLSSEHWSFLRTNKISLFLYPILYFRYMYKRCQFLDEHWTLFSKFGQCLMEIMLTEVKALTSSDSGTWSSLMKYQVCLCVYIHLCSGDVTASHYSFDRSISNTIVKGWSMSSTCEMLSNSVRCQVSWLFQVGLCNA